MARPSRDDLIERITALVEPLLTREGYELVAVEVVGRGPSTILRLYIDKPGGVTLDDCALVSDAVNPLLDVEDPFESSYSLEVSSPGLDRPLRKPEDFTRFAGRKARLKTFGPLPEAGNRKLFVGTLQGLEGDAVRIEVEGTVYSVPREELAKANLVFELETGTKGKKKNS